jgi:hypothetical protein
MDYLIGPLRGNCKEALSSNPTTKKKKEKEKRISQTAYFSNPIPKAA